MNGKLIIGGVDLGNIKDIPTRVLDYFDTADLVVTEWEGDFLEKFAKVGKMPKNGYLPFVGQQPGNDVKLEKILGLLRDGKTVLLIVGDGMPVICDPGHDIIYAAKRENIPMTIIPGPCVVSSSLAISGFLAEKYIFEGDIPETREERIAVFDQYKKSTRPVVFLAIRYTEAKMFKDNVKDDSFLLETLKDMRDHIGADRDICLCFNLTRDTEFIFNGTVEESVNWYEKLLNNGKDIGGVLSIVIDGRWDGSPYVFAQ